MDASKSNGNSQTKMTIQDVRNVLYSKEFWEAQRSYIGAKRNLDSALREVRYNLDRANTIDCDVKSKYGNEDQKSQSKLRSSISSENKRYYRESILYFILRISLKEWETYIRIFKLSCFFELHVSAFTIEVTQYKAEFRHGANCRGHRHIHFQRVQIAFVDRL